MKGLSHRWYYTSKHQMSILLAVFRFAQNHTSIIDASLQAKTFFCIKPLTKAPNLMTYGSGVVT
jgi:hypothetical protein